MKRLAIVCSHPVQYYAPWFRVIAETQGINLKVFYLWDFGSRSRKDPEFEIELKWNLDLLEGYPSKFVSNLSPIPGTNNFFGLVNPSLLSQLKDFNPDACLVFGYSSFSFLLLRLLGSTKYKLIFRGDSHLLGRAEPIGIKRAILSSIFSGYSSFLYVGKSNRAYFEYYGVDDSKLFFCPHAVDNDRFIASNNNRDIREELNIPAGSTLFAFVGKFIEKKRPLDLLQAFKKTNLENAHLLFVGSGPLEQSLKEQATDTRISFLPFVNQNEIPDVYRNIDVLVLPSAGPYETWGLSVNEAFCCDTAAIVSDQTGCAADLVEGQDTGLVFETSNTDKLQECLEQTASSPDRLRIWKDNALKLIDNYSYSKATAGLLSAIDYACEKG